MDKKIVIKLQFFIFLMSAGNSCFGTFLPVYFNSRRLTFTEIGIAFAVSSIISVIFQPVWGFISDKYLNKKKTLLVAIILNIFMIIFFIKAGSFGVIISLIILNSMFMCAIMPITDAYIFDVVDEKGGLSYSNFRFISSAAWGIGNLILGYVIRDYGIEISFIIYEVLATAGMLLLIGMKYEGKRSLKIVEPGDIKLLLKDSKLILFLLTVFIGNAAFMGGTNYMNELIKFTGGDVSQLGMAWFITAVFEVATFFITVKVIKKVGLINVYIISMLIYGVKFFLDFILNNANYIIAFQALEGFAFTLFLTSGLEYLNIKTNPKIRATAMSLYAASGGFGAFCAGLLGGMVLNIISPSQLYGLFALLCLISSICALGLGSEKLDSSPSVVTE